MGKSKLDGHADWLMMKSNLDVRTIARQYKETFGTSISHVSIAAFYKRQKEKLPEIAQLKADVIARVTSEVLEGESVRILNDIREGFQRAKQAEDERMMAVWTAEGRKWVEMFFKAWQPASIVIERQAPQETNILTLLNKWLEEG